MGYTPTVTQAVTEWDEAKFIRVEWDDTPDPANTFSVRQLMVRLGLYKAGVLVGYKTAILDATQLADPGFDGLAASIRSAVYSMLQATGELPAGTLDSSS